MDSNIVASCSQPYSRLSQVFSSLTLRPAKLLRLEKMKLIQSYVTDTFIPPSCHRIYANYDIQLCCWNLSLEESIGVYFNEEVRSVVQPQTNADADQSKCETQTGMIVTQTNGPGSPVVAGDPTDVANEKCSRQHNRAKLRKYFYEEFLWL